MITLLRKKPLTYSGRHADDQRAPTGTACVNCGAKEPPPGVIAAEGEDLLKLVQCSVCPGWLCSGACFSLHRAPASFYAPQVRRSWWRRWRRRG